MAAISNNIDAVFSRLTSESSDVKQRLEAATQLRDSLEHYTSGYNYPGLLRKFIPVFKKILQGQPVFISTSGEQQLRNRTLEILQRLPTSPPEAFEPYAIEMVELLIGLVRVENEDNCILCVKIIMDIMRHQVKVLSAPENDQVQKFLTLIQDMFRQIPTSVNEQLGNGAEKVPSTPGTSQTNFQNSPRPGSPVASVSDLGADPQQQTQTLLKGMQSFKVLAECPIIVVSIFQAYRSTVPPNVKKFVPLITEVLQQEAEPQKQSHLDAASKNKVFTGVSPNIRNRVAFGEFITAQVKVMSFLAYLLRVYSQQLTEFIPELPGVVIRLLKDCPREKSGTRKELLVAIRHIINFNFRQIFISHIDELLDEKTLIGDGLTVYETMRPLAYSMLADLIHHVRDKLTPDQIRKTVEVFTKNLLDHFPGTSFQTMSAKLLLNMAECIAKLENKADARHYLIMILNAIGDKFAAMNREYPNAVKQSKQAAENKQESFLADKENPPDWDEIDIFYAVPIKTTQITRERQGDAVADNKFLFRNLMNGLKNTFYQLKACNSGSPVDPANAPQHWQDVSYGFTAEEVQVIIKLFKEGAYVFRYYEIEQPATDSQSASPVEFMANHYMVSSSKEEKDLLETFATVFHCIDPATFHEVFHEMIPHLYEMIFEHTTLLHIPQFFLASEATSPSFAGMLLRFLMDRLDQVGTADVKKSSILLRLFKLAFMAVTLFSNQNEQVLLPHVLDIITRSIELSTTAEDPINYFLLLRSLFRAIGGGKFEHLYKQILPLIEMLLEVLNNLLNAARKPLDRDLYVELCLTVPARLSHLLPHLSYLMRPLVIALSLDTERIPQGLRTLELCVDNLTADYLDPIMAPVINELMTALFSHLRPTPYSHFYAHTTLRILGKMGGRNRKFMTGAPQLTFQQYSDDKASFDLRLIGSKKDRAFPAEIGLELAIEKLMEVPKDEKTLATDAYYKKQALLLVKSQIKLRIGFDTLPDDFARLVRLQAQDLTARKTEVDFSALENSDRSRSVLKKDAQEEMLKRLIKTLMFCCSLPDLKDESEAFLINICRHLTIIEVGRSLADLKHKTQAFNVKAGEGPLVVDSRVLADAIVESLASDSPAVRDAAEMSLQEVYNSTVIIFGSEARVGGLGFFPHMSSTFCHSCYEEEWFTKAGGSLGLKLMTTKIDLGDQWIADRILEFVKALMFVIKDTPQDLPAKTRFGAQDTLEILLRRVGKKFSKKDLEVPAPVPHPVAGMVRAQASRLLHLCTLFSTELSHLNKHVRLMAQKALSIMAESIDVQVHELVEPVKSRVLDPIYSKPLRALPFATQIGYIDAVTYCMGLKEDFVSFDDHLNRLLMESLALADASDDSLAGKPQEQRTHESIINLRVACIKMLTTAMTFDEYQKGSNNPTRTKIVSVFFKCLYSESKPTIEAANNALKVVLHQTSKLPKDLLQNGLRPVLANLQDPRRLSTHGLDGLARLLQLLTTYFKVEIGARLLDHIKVLAEPSVLQRISFTLVEQNESMKIIAAVFNIFHLLPPAASQFKERLIDIVLSLEENLRRTRSSPFREPLYKYLNRYPEEVWNLLLSKIEDQKYGRLLAQVLGDLSSGPLRTVAVNHVENLIKSSGDMGQENREMRYSSIISAINIMHSVSMFPGTQSWMDKKETLLWFKLVGKNLEQRLRSHSLPQNLRLAAEQAGEQLVAIFTKYLKSHPKDFDALFDLVASITNGELRACQYFFAYIYQNIICNDSIAYWKEIITRSMDVYANKSASQKNKMFLLHNFVNPIFAMDIMRTPPSTNAVKGAPRLVDKNIIDTIHSKVWRVGLGDPTNDLTQSGIDHTRMEVLQLSAMLVKYHHTLVQDARKDIIKFGWTYIRLEDVINKHAAYVVIGYFVAHYETPSKIVIQVYQSLLRTNQNEGRALILQTLELLAPVLPKRCGCQPGDRNPPWAQGARRILAEEGQNIQQMTGILHFLVRHPDLFYESRDKFAMAIISSLRKIAIPNNASHENRRLVLSLMGLIWEWEKRRVEGSGGQLSSESPNVRKRKLENMSEGSSASPSPSTKLGPPASTAQIVYQLPAAIRMKMIKYLVEFISGVFERYPLPLSRPKEPANFSGPIPVSESREMINKAMTILYDLLSPEYWGDLDIDIFTMFPHITEVVLNSEKTVLALSTDGPDKEKNEREKLVTSMINSIQAIRVILTYKSDEYVQKNMTQLQRLLEKSIKSDNVELQDALHYANKTIDSGREYKPLMKRILDAVPDDVQMEDADADGETEASTSEIITFLSTTATEDMSSTNYLSGINILWTLAQRKPSEMDQHIPAIMRALQLTLAKEHVAHWTGLAAFPLVPLPSKPGDVGPNNQLHEHDLEIQTGLILKAIDIMSMRMEVLGDNRRPFLSVLATLVEKSQSNQLCLKILDMVEGWVFRSEGSWPTLKEKTAVLHKMLTFESRTDQTLLIKFLELVIRIYEDPRITRTELTVRMEHAFLIGTRAQDVTMRNRFMAIFDKSQPKAAYTRLNYVITSQNWDTLADSFWLAQASQLLVGSIETSHPLQLHHEDFKTMPLSLLFNNYSRDPRSSSQMDDDKYEEFMAGHRRFVNELGDIRVRDIMEPLVQLQHLDSNTANELWVALYPMYWSATLKDDRSEVQRGLVSLLTKDYHSRQIDKRPNVVQALLDGAARSDPECKIPPHVLKYEAKTYDAWYTALVQLEEAAIKPTVDSPKVRESNLDALIELYAGLGEEDLFYGTWRRRCQFVETNAALSLEQNGMWDAAQKMYEAAQIKARTGAIPFSQSEYMLWEDHWVVCAQKLQQWEILQEFAKHENFQDLLLECAWRNFDMWQNVDSREQLDSLIKGVMDAPTPRRTFFQAFMSLLKLHNKTERQEDFSKVCDEAIQLSIRKWHQLPKRITNAHIPLLQNFQQLVELHDASIICQSLSQTTQQNLDVKSQELKLLLGTWRDRLPNVWDDITAWQDLVTWRQHIFGMINSTYLNLLPPQGQNASGASFAYRGYHETAWIINRFAHVARKHQLPEVCISQLSRIYTLPNIEIQEAFLKLREQAKCHYQNFEELGQGLDVINNTNLNYFGPQQKAEFYTLKGMFLDKLNNKQEAEDAYGMALFFDIKLPKAWAEWGRYNDNRFRENPQNYDYAKNAVSCYLEAAGVWKNAKSRKLLTRILWLLSLDNAEGVLGQMFDNYKGETPVWYWITFIPQLLTGLGHKEANKAHVILEKIAKSFPQALYFQLRTNREDMLTIKKNTEQKDEKLRREKAARAAQAGQTQAGQRNGTSVGQNGAGSNVAAANADNTASIKPEPVEANISNGMNGIANNTQTDNTNGNGPAAQTPGSDVVTKKPPWEHTEEILSVLKTAFPLLALSMETMVDSIQKNFKCPPDEDAYRLIVALLNDGLSYVSRSPSSYAPEVKLPAATEANITRFAETILPSHIRKSFEADFVVKKPTMYEYIHKLRKWRDKFEERLDRRTLKASLEHYSAHLCEFRFAKFDDVEIPGQYLQHKDKNQDFVRIERFLPDVDLVRGIGVCHRRLKIRGHDGSIHPFAIQHPAARHCRREERILQLFRHFNGILSKRKESRRRNLNFHLPLMIPLAPHIRMVQDDPSYVTLQGIFEDHCRSNTSKPMSKDDPILFTMDKMRSLSEAKSKTVTSQEHLINARIEIFTAIQEKWAPHTIALDYFKATYPSFAEFWLFRRQFSYQYAALTFMTYILHMNNRYPHKLSIARATGNVWGSELIANIASGRPQFNNTEMVPFRLTPNIQTLMGPIATEGIYSCAIMAIARCLSEPEIELEQQLSLFVRDEMIFWFTSSHRSGQMTEVQLRETVMQNSELIVKRCLSLAQEPKGVLPANQTVIDLIARAVNPLHLAQTDALWMPYL